MLDAVSNLSKREREQSLYDFCKKKKTKRNALFLVEATCP